MTSMGKYQLIRRLGRGGMAEVYLAKTVGPRGFEKTLVVKRILPHLVEDPHFIEMFLSEAMLAARLNHANVVQIFDFGEEEGSHFIAMEYIDGPSLHALIQRAAAQQTPIPFPLCAKIVSFACEGLAYAHELADPDTGKPLELIHRDISPDNVLLSRNGGVKVVDFGIAKAADSKHRTQTGIVKGKVAYMSPEHLLGEPLDPRADVFALGVVLYELITGQQPFEAESDVRLIQAILHQPMVEVRERRQDAPEALGRIVEKALAKDREQRYRSCRELQADLERFLLQCGEPVGPAQLAALVKKLFPPEGGSGSVTVALPSPQASMEAPSETLPRTEVLPLAVVRPDAPVQNPHTAEPVEKPAGPRSRVRTRVGVPLVILLAGVGGYLGLRGMQRTPERLEGGGTVPEPARQAPPVTEAPAVQKPEPVEQKPPEPPPPSPPEETPALARFRVVSKPSGRVSINGKRVGRSPVDVEVPPGKVQVSVEGDDDGERFATSQTVAVTPGVNAPVSLEPKRVKVTVRGRPRDFEVQSLDIHFLGGSAGPVEVYEGWHTVKLRDPAGKSHTAECQAKAGEDLCLFEVKDGSP